MSSKVDDVGTNRKHVCDFLLVRWFTLVISRTVSEIRRLIGWKLRIFPTLLSFGAPPLSSLWNLAVKLSIRKLETWGWWGYSVVKVAWS